MKTKILFLGLILSLLTIGCSKDKDDTATVSGDDAKMNSKMDQVSNDVQDVVESQLFAQNPSFTGKGIATANALLPACATVTTTTTGNTWTREVNFGTTGCPMANGNILKGIIRVSGTLPFNNQSYVATYTFDNFYHNNVLVQGTRTVTRSFASSTNQSTPHPIYVMDINMSLTYPVYGTYTRVGSRTRELITGFDTATIDDNIYVVSGSWTTTRPSGVSHNVEITTPLRFDFAGCPSYKLVSGNLHFTKNNHYADLNYGSGNCDNVYTISIDGGTPISYTF